MPTTAATAVRWGLLLLMVLTIALTIAMAAKGHAAHPEAGAHYHS